MGDRTDAPKQSRAIELPFHGAQPSVDSWDAVLEAVARQLEPGEPLIGYSMGGRVALGIADRFPELVSSLTVIAAHPGLDDAERADRRMVDHQHAQRLRNDPDTFLSDWRSQPMFGPQTSETWRSYHSRHKIPQQWADGLEVLSVAEQPNYRHVFDAIPITFVVGEHDLKYRRVAETLDANIVVVPDAWHAVHRDRPDVIGALIG